MTPCAPADRCRPSRRDCVALGLALLVAPLARAVAVDETWHDARRHRDLPLRLRAPTTPGPWPLVVFSHGLGGSREGGDVWSEAWAAAGCLVVHVQHPGSDTEIWRAGLKSLRAAASAEQLGARVADVRFVLDEIARRQQAGEVPWRNARLDAIGMAGHSFGAITTQALAGQRYGLDPGWADARPRAFIAFSPSLGRNAMSPTEQFGAVTRPFLAITGSLDGDPFGSFATGEPRARVFDGLPRGQRALLWLEGADHMSFGGNAQRRLDARAWRRSEATLALEPAHHALVARVTAQWWRAQLLGDVAARAALARPEGLSAGDRWVFD